MYAIISEIPLYHSYSGLSPFSLAFKPGMRYNYVREHNEGEHNVCEQGK